AVCMAAVCHVQALASSRVLGHRQLAADRWSHFSYMDSPTTSLLPGRIEHLRSQRIANPKSSLALQLLEQRSDFWNKALPLCVKDNSKATACWHAETRRDDACSMFIDKQARSLLLDSESNRLGLASIELKLQCRGQRRLLHGRSHCQRRKSD